MPETDRDRLVRLTVEWAELRRQLAMRPDDRELLARERQLDGALEVARLQMVNARMRATVGDPVARLAQLRHAAAARWN